MNGYRWMKFFPLVSLVLMPCVVTCLNSFAQDEAWIRETLTQKIVETDEKTKVVKNFSVYSDLYRLDLNGDGHKEGITIETSDAGHELHLFNPHLMVEKSFYLSSFGHKGHIKKLELRRISTAEHALLIFLYEGVNSYLNLQSSMRLYVLYIPSEGISAKTTKNIFKGPVIYEEYLRNGHYHTRKYNVILKDLNKDGVKEILIKYSKNERVIILDKNKNWKLI